MEHVKVVDAVKAQRTVASEAFAEITRLKAEAFEAIEAEKQQIEEQKRVLKEQASQLKVSEKEVFKA